MIKKKSEDLNKTNMEIINKFEPKIKKSLHQTNVQDRDDLSQHIKLKILQSLKRINYDQTPGFYEFKNKIKWGD